MNVRLPSVAVIPDELYVERAADRQLASIIRAMGRPGYVLDPRQMGKTNLLLHARRALGSDQLRFLYVDLSVRVRSAAAFYRRLLEIAVATQGELFGTELIARGIEELRNDEHADPADLFERTLITVLEGWPGKLVIILDEVDGLTGRAFSDGIFAHIRSLFFAGDSTVALKRLTFVLAGVAEPAQLIKDKSISPFNIGQKIFLRDFTTEQVAELLRKATLSFPDAVLSRIMHWTNGNPRPTWDLVAELDVVELGGEKITPDTVDDAVDRLFLTSFDRPPVDHIRTLVSSDHELKRAVVALRKGEDLSDRQRGMLYLAGVATQVPGDRQPEFRNRIIDRAISDRWLREVDTAARHQLVSAQIAFRERRFIDAVRAFQLFAEGHEWVSDDRQDVLKLAISQFELGQFDRALESFDLFAFLSPARPDAALLLWTARTKAAQGAMQEAERDYRAALDANPTPVEKMRIAISLGRIAASDPGRIHEARQFAEQAIDLARSVGERDTGQALERFQVQALELLAVLSDGDERQTALDEILKFRGLPPSLSTMTMLVSDRDVAPEADVRLLRQAFISADLTKRSVAELGSAAIAIRKAAGRGSLEEAVRELAERSGVESSVVWGLTFDALVQAKDLAAMEIVAADILDEGLVGGVRPSLALRVGRTVLLEQASASGQLVDRYLTIVARGDEHLTRNDHLTLLSIAAGETGGTHLNQRLLEAAAGLTKPSEPRLRQSFVLVRYVQVLAAIRARDHEMAQRLAQDGLLLIDEIHAAPEKELPSDLIAEISDFLARAAQIGAVRHPKRNPHRRFGRNDQITVEYRDGTRLSAKYKTLSQDLELGACAVVFDTADELS